MRFLTWNCRSGPYAAKSRILSKLRFDIAVVPESSEPDATSEQLLWFGDDRGLLVAASAEYRLCEIALGDLPRFFVPIQVTGPQNFLLIAVWAMPNERETRYVRGVMRAVERCAPLIAAQPTVLLGDFNSNTFWDRKFPRTANHTSLVAKLDELGCVSAYHAFRGERHGAESAPTFFQYNHEDKPYHLDYCFVPRHWNIRNVLVGRYDQWQRWSDHRPVIVEAEERHETSADQHRLEVRKVRRPVEAEGNRAHERVRVQARAHRRRLRLAQPSRD